MNWLSHGVKVGLLAMLLVGGGYVVWSGIGTTASGSKNYTLSAKFRDASGLPVGSAVMIAGLPVGEISVLAIDGRYAKLTFLVRDDVVVWSNAVVLKKSSSLLGAYYLEIDPGMPQSINSGGQQVQNTRLEDGDTIERVVEATSPDELMRRIEETMPNVDNVLLSVRDLADDLRRIVNGPLQSIMDRVDDLVQSEAETVSRILARADRSLERIELITADVRKVTRGSDEKVDKILDNIEKASQEARELIASVQKEVEDTGTKVREKLDLVDEVLVSSSSIAKKIDENEGTLGRLVNDPTIADNVEEITEDAKDFLGGLFGLQTYVGLRTEFNVFSRLSRSYVTVELATRPDKFYYIEFERGPRGGYPEVTLEYDPTVDRTQYVRKVLIEDKLRFTFQIAKRINWATFRFGIKESTGGVGVDIETTWLGRTLRVNTDVFDMSFDQLPRLKVSAAYEVFKNLYVLGGIDEALNDPETLVIDTGEFDEPVQFEEFRYGRDYFLGAMLRFNDRDLAALLTVGGSTVTKAAE
ncbi:MAG: MlaD family protein [Proteobacteria bacterium]|nr:MlaD family protein [Pseudomonadota bacterium]